MQYDNLIHDMYMRQLMSGQTYQRGGKMCASGAYSGGAGEYQRFLQANKNKGLSRLGLRCEYWKENPNKPRPKSFNQLLCNDQNLVKSVRSQRHSSGGLDAYRAFTRDLRARNPNVKLNSKQVACEWHKLKGTPNAIQNVQYCKDYNYLQNAEQQAPFLPFPLPIAPVPAPVLAPVQIPQKITQKRFIEAYRITYPTASHSDALCAFYQFSGKQVPAKMQNRCLKFIQGK